MVYNLKSSPHSTRPMLKTKITDTLSWAHPLVHEWFLTQVGSPTLPQIQGWPPILAGKSTLIAAPTGSGKTFAAFLICIDKLVKQAIDGTLEDETHVLYISPLKALGNDIQKNLLQPLNEILLLAQKQSIEMRQIRVSVRSGDTPAKERQQMLKKPPHILVTTPESLYLLLTAEKSRVMLKTVKTVIVDEIHAMAHDKRGAHLALSLERLQDLTPVPAVRIGLSATQKPIQLIAHFLTGNHRPLPTIVNIGHAKQLELSVAVPSSELSAVASNEMWEEIYDELAELAQQNRSTLIFANTRRMAERTAHHLALRLGQDKVAAHHGSLSKKLRLAAETKLKQGHLKALVATASLELGIDIGHVDLVCQLGSPRSIAVMLQRIGRAGHWHGAVSKGRIFVSTRDELIECAALVHAIHEGDLDKIIFPYIPLDILAQQIVASCATKDMREDELFDLVKQAFHYKDLRREEFDEVIEMLSEGITGSRGRYGAYLFRDRIHGQVKARRSARMVAITSGGAIPENGLFTVIAEPTGLMVGTLDEDFAVESHRGDIILLGSTSWKIQRVESTKGRVLVEDAHGAPPTVPFWRGEAPARTAELSLRVSDLREHIHALLPQHCSPTLPAREQPFTLEAIEWLEKHCKLDRSGAEQLVEYILQGRALLGAVPSQHIVIAERFFDEAGGMQLIIHAPFGARINKAWGLALRKCFCRTFNFELQASATDDGINIALTEQHSFPLQDVFHFINPKTLKKNLTQAVLQSPLFQTRWRWDAGRALAILRFRNGKKVPPHIMRILSEDLLAAVFPDAAACQDNLAGRDLKLPNQPLVNEAIKDCLTEALDVEGLEQILKKMAKNEIRCLAVDTPTPSQFAHEILNANPYAFLDDAPLEERRARAVQMRQTLPDVLLDEIGKLDPSAIKEVVEQVWPDIRNADELHDFLQTVIALPLSYCANKGSLENWQPYFKALHQSGRAGYDEFEGETFWFAMEKTAYFSTLYKMHAPTQANRDEVLLNFIRSWIFHTGPVSAQDLSQRIHLEESEVEQALLKLESTGLILRGTFQSNQTEWCERRLLARIHRMTLEKLRQKIKPVTAAQFVKWLMSWQHVSDKTQLNGELGLLEVLKQLQGFEAPAKAWEKEILPQRLRDYQPATLDKLCLMGVIGWGRLSTRLNAGSEAEETHNFKKINPTSIAPMTFFLREETAWMPESKAPNTEENLSHLSAIAQQVYYFLKTQGASFLMDIVQGVHHLKVEVEMALWELVTAGFATADSFDNLRALIDPRRRLNKKRRRPIQPLHHQSRWSLLKLNPHVETNQHLESLCKVLLKRYGVVFRDLLKREKNLPRWRDLLITYRRLEDRGDVRGGRFVDGFLGEQFALPEAVVSLRSMREEPVSTVTIAAVDPLNLIGIILPGERTSAVSGKQVTLSL